MKLSIKESSDERGKLVFASYSGFTPRNTYWITGSTKTRGGHAHKKTRQILICMKGEIIIRTDKEDKSGTVLKENEWFYQDTNIFVWMDFSGPDDILLVMADAPYNPNDYIYE